MTIFDKIYKDLYHEIIDKGYDSKDYGDVRTRYADGTPAHYKFLLGYTFRFKVIWSNGSTYPILTTRRVPYKSAINEMFWICLFQSNNVDDLVNKLNCKFWNEWKLPDGTIGKAYGYQMTKPTLGYNSQMEYVIETLKKDKNSRRCITEIWVPEELKDMSLTPCVHHTQWSVVGNELVLHVSQRSCDFALGLVSNVFQYSVLQKLVAEELDLEVGELIWTIHNVHIYDRHLDTLKEQLDKPLDNKEENFYLMHQLMPPLADFKGKLDAWQHIPKSFTIINYNPEDYPEYKYEVAI